MPVEEPGAAEEKRLAAALTTEAERVRPSADGWRFISSRLAQEPAQPASPAGRPRRNSVIAAALAVGLAAAATIFATTGGVRRDSTPGPALTPTAVMAPTSTPGLSATLGPASRTSWTVYRLSYDSSNPSGFPVLRREEVPVSPPYEPRQALDEMFSTPPADPLSVAGEGANRVASVRLTEQAIVLDMGAVNQTRPSGMVGDAMVAKARIQSWVWTLQDAYATKKPVLITLNGKPFTLLGAVDTKDPIRRSSSLEVVSAHEIFMPRAGESVTSPVVLRANVPAGVLHWQVEDLLSGKTLFNQTLKNNSSAHTVGFVRDLPPGQYRFTVNLVPPEKSLPPFERSVDFEVSG